MEKKGTAGGNPDILRLSVLVLPLVEGGFNNMT